MLIDDFKLGSLPSADDREPYFWFLFHKDKILLKKTDEAYKIPDSMDVSAEDLVGKSFYIGSIDNNPCYASRLLEEKTILRGMEAFNLRQAYAEIGDVFFQIAGRALQIVNWDENHRFCGKCGEKTEDKIDEHAKICPHCGLFFYPRLSPAIIVAIVKDNKILLAKNKNSITGFYSVLAGFVEAGESLEECVRREVREEVGIEIKNVEYFGSQPWPFPNSLMIGFTAEYDKGEIVLQENEIQHADWFEAGDMPQIPGSISISRKLIDWFIGNNK
ncbi:NAD(+) diphosphatase [Lutispora saccharofermentans]|uniref:NAD(+) diphosphatase n=1 Tax=Lutispora saccharofermentans TaxID=3024236 RepID=UPI002FDE9F29